MENRGGLIVAAVVTKAALRRASRQGKRIEEPFGWGKTIGGPARPLLRGAAKLGFKFVLTMAACCVVSSRENERFVLYARVHTDALVIADSADARINGPVISRP
jgi:hypothetical protein